MSWDKPPNWFKQQWQIARYYWRWLWMSQAEQKQARAMRKILFNLLGNAPMDKIRNRESCSWDMNPKQETGTMEGVKQYVKAVTGEDV